MMKLFAAMALPASVAAAAAAAAPSAVEKGTVFTLTDANQEEFFKTNATSLVKFYAPWCGHCKQMAPAYEEAAKKLGEEASPIVLAKVDATVEPKLPEAHEVRGYPTLKFFLDGVATEYDGPRDAAGMVAWLKQMSGPAVSEGEADKAAGFSVTLVAAAPSAAFEQFAKAHRRAAAFHFVRGEASKLVFAHKGEEAVAVTEGLASAEGLAAAFEAHRFPLFGPLSGETFGSYVDAGAPLVWSLFAMTEETAATVVEENRATMTAAARQLEKTNVTWTNTAEFGSVLENMFGITEYPRVVYQAKAGDRKKFIFTGEITADNVVNFVRQCEAGEIEPELKSEPVPAEAKSGEVRKVVGKTMKSMLLSKEKDVLFKVHAPWCGHCKQMQGDYERAAREADAMGLEPVLMFAELDGTENDSAIDALEWQGFPTLWYFRAGQEAPVEYTGARDNAGIWAFIKEHHSSKAVIEKALEKKAELDAAFESEKQEDEAEAETKELEDFDDEF